MKLLTALVRGPAPVKRGGKGGNLLLVLPFIVLAAVLAAEAPPPTLFFAVRTVGLAACASVIGVLLSLPASCLKSGFWLVALLFMPGLGIAGWALAGPADEMMRALERGCLLVPVGALFLRAAWRGLPACLARAAMAQGATGAQALRHVVLPLGWPAVPRAGVLLFILALGSFL